MTTANEHLISATDLTPVVAPTGELPDHKGIWVGAGGTLVVETMNGQAVTISGIASGTLLPIRVREITGGTASAVQVWF